MAREWWRRLPAAQRREYERSEAISYVRLPASPALGEAVLAVDDALASDDLARTQQAAQLLVGRICAGLGVPPARVRVDGVRPHDQRGELHGLYTPAGGTASDRITVWMRTAKRREVVRTRTFLRTLLHEVCHHLDFALLDLPSSFHTKGFYQRESSLFRVIVRGTPLAGDPRTRPAAPEPPPDRPQREAIDDEAIDGIALLRAAAAAIAARQRGGSS